MSYTHLSKKDRAFIALYLRRGRTQRWIAKELGVHPSTISREISRNKSPKDKHHLAKVAQKRAESRWKYKQEKNKKMENNYYLEEYIESKLRIGWSPEQIQGRIRYLQDKGSKEVEGLPDISFMCIYRWINTDRPDLKKYLRRKGRRKKKHLNINKNKEIKLIDKRDKYIEERKILGHLEGDTIHGKDVKQRILTLVDRKSRMLFAAKVEYDSYDVYKKITSIFKQKELRSILNGFTFDQGSEFAAWTLIERSLNTKVYFTYPRSPWQKGSNENTNGLLREYLPKNVTLTK